MTVITQTRTARKPHECSHCHQEIKPGEKYIRHALTPNDSEIQNPRWWVQTSHTDDNYECLAASGRL